MLNRTQLSLPFCLFLSLLLSIGMQAQAPSNTTIRGVVVDTGASPVPFATVMLLNPQDSTLQKFTTTDNQGSFAFKNVRNQAYLLKVSFVSYLPKLLRIDPATGDLQDVGRVEIRPITQELMEVVVRTAKAPLRIKGDTIEYDATTFKVPPGSTVEDLLRRLPGIEVDADGNIKAQGKSIRRLTVDGKSFFGGDPKSATKNLGAETISKVQVYNEKSEQAQLTGVDDGQREKAMNLELKPEFRKGAFGKVTVGGGNEGRWASRGNYNRFNEKQQLSFIGYGNNINQTGVNWEDYSEFRGQNTFNNFDNGDFGFGSGRNFIFFGGGDELLNNFDGRGFTRNFGTGVNYNFDDKKRKLNTSYVYNQTDLRVDQFGFQQNFLADSSFFNTDTSANQSFRDNHRLNTRFEANLDSNNVLIVKLELARSSSQDAERSQQLFSGARNQNLRQLEVDNSSDLASWRVQSTAIYRRKFKKKGRSFAWSGAFNFNRGEGDEQIFSLNRFFQATTFTEQIRQLNNNLTRSEQWKTSLLFTEPLSKKWFLETFTNLAQGTDRSDRQVFDLLPIEKRNEDLSFFYQNTNHYQRVGSSVRYSFNGLNASVGLAGQNIQLVGAVASSEDAPFQPALNRSYFDLVPNASLNYEFTSNSWLGLDYGYNINAPNFFDLQPLTNVNNPAFVTLGNPNLSPESSHQVSLNLGFWSAASQVNGGINFTGVFFDNRIVYNQTIEVVDSIGIRTTTFPVNIAAGRSLQGFFWSGFPIIKGKWTVNLNGNLNFDNSPAAVNEVENNTRTASAGLYVSTSLIPNDFIQLGLEGRLNVTEIRYSIQSEQNQDIANHGVDASLKWQFAPKFFLESNLDYSVFRNDRFGFNQSIAIWNASVRRLLGKTNKLEMRLAAFDLLNQRVAIGQNGAQNFVARNIANTLARYFMASLSYNLRGYDTKLRKNNFF